MTTTNYHKHLYFEKEKDSKEYAIAKCMNILGLIARVKDRNAEILENAERYGGRSHEGKLLVYRSDLDKIRFNKEVINILQRYFNNCLHKVKRFECKPLAKLN